MDGNRLDDDLYVVSARSDIGLMRNEIGAKLRAEITNFRFALPRCLRCTSPQ